MMSIYYNKMEAAKYLVSRGASIDLAITTYEHKISEIDGKSSRALALKQALVKLKALKSSPPARVVEKSSENLVLLNDGSELRGNITTQDRRSITLKTKHGVMKIEKKNIKEIRYK